MNKVVVEFYAESVERVKNKDKYAPKTIRLGHRQKISQEESHDVKKNGYYYFHNTRPNGMNDAYGYCIKAKAKVVKVTTITIVTERYV